MFAFANVFHLFAHELAGLRSRSTTFALVFSRSFYGLFFRHIGCWRARSGAGACLRRFYFFGCDSLAVFWRPSLAVPPIGI